MKLGKNKGIDSFILVSVLCAFITVLIFTALKINIYAEEDPEKELRTGAFSYFGSNGVFKDETYEKKGGGYYAGVSLFDESYDLDEAKFNELTNDAQSEFIEDFAYACENVNDSSDNVTDQTVDNWWKQLQKKSGMGSKFLTEVLSDTKPDFVTAKKWYMPFSGPIGTMLAFGSIITLALLGIVMVCDILYITIPPVRIFVDDNANSESKINVSKIFSYAAISAVREAESNSDGKTKKHALGLFLKNRILEIMILCICLLYLVQGEIYKVVGWVLNLLTGITS